jgi:hypothetical protein
VNCESAAAITVFPFLAQYAVTISGLNATSTDNNFVSSCNQIVSETTGSWVQFMGNNTCITAHYSSAFLAVYTGDNCSSLSCVGQEVNNGKGELEWFAKSNQQYWVYTGGVSSEFSDGSYAISLMVRSTCIL